MELSGRVVAITGAARGIGRATAHALAARGARVGIGDLDGVRATATAAELGVRAVGAPLDVTDSASFRAFLDTVEAELGPLDVLVNNAGVMLIGPFLEEDDGAMDLMLDVNVRGVIVGCRLAAERLLARGMGGHIVNVASMAGKVAVPGGASYCASKHAVVGLSEALRLELAPAGVGVSVVLPSQVRTDLTSGLTPGRLATPPCEPEVVAASIAAAVTNGRVEVFVPRSNAVAVRAMATLPRRLRDRVARLAGSDTYLLGADTAARNAYTARVRDRDRTRA